MHEHFICEDGCLSRALLQWTDHLMYLLTFMLPWLVDCWSDFTLWWYGGCSRLVRQPELLNRLEVELLVPGNLCWEHIGCVDVGLNILVVLFGSFPDLKNCAIDGGRFPVRTVYSLRFGFRSDMASQSVDSTTHHCPWVDITRHRAKFCWSIR